MVSVVIPNYNHAVYLKQRIDSVLGQTFTDYEIVILDDKSSDNSLTIIEEYRDHPKVKRIVINETNSGSPFVQWNAGVTQTEGEYVWIAESDDYTDPFFLERLVQIAQEFKEAGLIYCQSHRVSENNQIVGDWSKHTERLDPEKWKKPYCADGLDEVRKFFGYINVIPNASAVLIRREAYYKAGMADESFFLNGDWYLWNKILVAGYKVAYTPERLNYFRQHSEKVTSKAIKKGINVVEAYRVLDFLVKSKVLSDQQVQDLVRYYGHNYLVSIFNRHVPFSNMLISTLYSLRFSLWFTLHLIFKIVIRNIGFGLK